MEHLPKSAAPAAGGLGRRCMPLWAEQAGLEPDVLFGHFGPVKTGQQALGGAGRWLGLEAIEIGQLADDLLRRIAAPQVFEALVAVPLGQAAALLVQQQRTVGKGRGRQAQQPVQVDLPGGGGKQVCPPHHLGDPHPGVIHHHRQLIGKHAVGPAQVKIPAAGQQVFAVRPHAQVLEGDLLVGHHHPPGRSFDAALFGHLFRGQAAAGAGIDHIPVRGMGRAGGVQLGAAAKAGVYKTHGFQLLITFCIDLPALALVIGAMGAAMGTALVPHKAQPGQIFLQLVGIGAGTAGSVQILDPQHDASAPAFGRQPGQQAARQIAQMQPAAGAGGKPPRRAAHRPSCHTPSAGWRMEVL